MSSNLDCLPRGAFYRSLFKASALFGAFCVVTLGTSAVQATILTAPGGAVAVGSPSPTGGTVIASLSQPFVAVDNLSNPVFSGTLISQVVSGDPSNALGGLDFLYQIVSNVTSSDGIGRLTVNDYAGFLVNANFQTPNAGTIAPASFDRNTSDVIGTSFSFIGGAGPLMGGDTSSLIVLQTDAPNFQPTVASLIDGFTTSANTFAPAKATPEPGTLVLAAIGTVTLALVARRKRSKA